MPSEIVNSQERREGSGAIAISSNKLVFRSTWNFLVLASSTSVGREEILLGTPGLPVVGLVYGFTQQRCTSKDAKRKKENPLYWDVTCQFESGTEEQKPPSGGDPDFPDPDPTTWIPVFVVDSFETKQVVIQEDFSDPPKKIVNFAKQPFQEPILTTKTLCSFSFTQFEDPAQDINDIMDRNDKLNDGEFAGRDARTLKLNVTSAGLGYYGGYAAWRVAYRCSYDPDTWDVELLEVGSQYVDTADGNKLKPYLDDIRSHRMVGKLDTNGNKLASNANPLTSKFVPYQQIDFSFIRLPS
jgi:hypothetical protein